MEQLKIGERGATQDGTAADKTLRVHSDEHIGAVCSDSNPFEVLQNTWGAHVPVCYTATPGDPGVKKKQKNH